MAKIPQTKMRTLAMSDHFEYFRKTGTDTSSFIDFLRWAIQHAFGAGCRLRSDPCRKIRTVIGSFRPAVDVGATLQLGEGQTAVQNAALVKQLVTFAIN